MKMNKFTSALVAMGVVSLASVASANTVIYLTGSTAARGNIFSAATTPGDIFTGTTTLYPASANSSSSQVVFEGNIAGIGTVDLDCDWSGSEAGIAAVAGQTLTQNVNGGTYNLPGVPPTFLTPASGFTTSAQLPSGTYPDLTMADTSQAVSQTSKATYPLTDYGVVGIVTFTMMKGYEATPDAAWNHVNNITTAEINQLLAGPLSANFVTGVSTDSGDGVYICGRNFGSGTRANAMLNFQYGLFTSVDQYAYDADYPSGTPGVLTFEGNYASGQHIVEVFNDGFDSGGSVAHVMNVDGTGSGNVLIGYLGVGDAAHAYADDNTGSGGVGAAANSGPATFLPFNGVWESDSAIENGSYSYWGQEHILGSIGQSSTSPAGETAAAIVSGLATQLTASGAGTKTGAVGPTYSAQSAIIPKSLMQATRASDGGFPTQGTFH